MDLLPWNCFLLKFCGFKTKAYLSKRRNILTTIHFWFRILILTLSTVAGLVLGFFMKDIGLKLIWFMISFYVGCNVVMFIIVSPNIAPFMLLLSSLSQQLNPKKRSQLRRQDKLSVVVLLVLCILPNIAGTIYVFCNIQEVTLLLKYMFYDQMTILATSAFMTACCWSMMMVLCTFYVAVLNIGNAHAEHTLHELKKALSTESNNNPYVSFHQPKKLLSEYISFVANVNDKLGLIPMTIFAVLFLNIVMLISFVSMASYVSVGMIFSTLAGTIATEAMAIILIITKSNKSTRNISQAFAVAQELSSKPLVKNNHWQVLEARRSLKTFLCQKHMPHVTAMSMFDIEPSIVLSFLNAVIPFTIMFVTTVLQITKDTTKNK